MTNSTDIPMRNKERDSGYAMKTREQTRLKRRKLDWKPEPALGAESSRPYSVRRCPAAARHVDRRTHAGSARRGEAMGVAAHRGVCAGARRTHRQPGGAAGEGGLERRSISAAGRSRPTPISPGKCIPTKACIRQTACPAVVKRINQALQRADQIQHAEGKNEIDWFAPIVADAEAGFGGPLNVFELTKAMIEAGAAGVHFEDQLASEKKCGHMGGKVLVPTRTAIAQPDRCAAGSRCFQCADPHHRAHRCQRAPPYSPATSTSATAHFSPANAPPKDSSASAPASIRRLRAD